ncbi:hypothetical protein [Micromonospora sp. NPDC049204]|uniref:hypothetical protein n=1 Tax=Micromonospora sp. NPDC049204 TaxID=3154351 RepID=UPI0033CD1F5C
MAGSTGMVAVGAGLNKLPAQTLSADLVITLTPVSFHGLTRGPHLVVLIVRHPASPPHPQNTPGGYVRPGVSMFRTSPT